ncbi:hypothetical protein GCM10022243_44260 [Saccharothrix violaceirubra]|uniref:Patatin-related protein n=1 Tax=Saccharothrix violaceirubra TaxID=413306 RepID=A0A7W7WUV4_9PSEU|nr:patatin-like protein [Saccharothrix violaceirubra]MBB4964685.1 patatin-related protein [Saccharothrix violaceirubra]
MTNMPREQIRFAVVLNGGVSLAVWMGGVVLELDRLTRSLDGYGDLLDLVGSTARADVISGTSAGGINGAALALSQVNANAKLERLRDLWAEQGRMEQLLRTPFRGAPVSLLKGDEFFLPRLREALERLAADYSPTPAADRPVDLRITTTLLAGVPTVTYDDLGQELVQSSHQGSFSFRRDPAGRDDFRPGAVPDLVERMALAARSSASFPFAFEPSYVPVGASVDGRPDMAAVASWADGESDLSRFVVDGGVLVNTPTREALEAIDRMPAEGPVRRVMLLVFPHAPDTSTDVVADGVPSTLGTGGRLLGALTSQGNRTYVERIEEHNRRAASRRGGRNALLDRLAGDGSVTDKLYALTDTLHDHFEDVRMRHAARDLTTRQLAVVGSNKAGWTFERVRAAAEAAQRAYRKKRGSLPYVPKESLPFAAPGSGWPWGISMAERLTAAAMDLLKRMVWVVPDTREEPFAKACPSIAGARTELYAIRTELREARRDVDAHWQPGVAENLDRDYWTRRIDGYAATMLGADSPGDRVRTLVERIVAVFGVAHEILPLLDDTRLDMGGLRSWCKLLAEPPTEAEAGLSAEDVRLSRVIALEIAATCLADDERDGMDQAVELVQISLRTRNAFADYSITPDDKAGGASLGRFSGFLKRSWRVNDWIWGRLDGATMLSKVIFDPRRLVRIDKLSGAHEREPDPAKRAASTVADLVAKLFGEVPDRLVPAVDKAVAELTAVYANPDDDHPPTCPALAELAAWALHVHIICEELPGLRAAILADRIEGADRRSRGELFLEEHDRLLAKFPVRTQADRVTVGLEALEAFDRAGIGREPLVQEAGSDQVIRTAATAAAVAITVVDGENSGFGPAKPLTRALRGAALLPYWTITGLTRGGRLAQFLGLLGFALGGALLVLALFDLLPAWAVGPAAALGGGTVLAAFGYAALRTGTLLHGLVLLAPVLPLAVVAVDGAREHIGSGDGSTGAVAVGGVVLVVLALLLIGSLPAPVGTPLAVLRRIRVEPRTLVRAAIVVLVGAGVWAVIRWRWYDLAPLWVGVAWLGSTVFGGVAAYWLGSSLRRWRRLGDTWRTEDAQPPASATAGWSAVYGAGFLAVAGVIQVSDLRFEGWEAVLGTALAFGLVLLLVTTWWVPLRTRRAIERQLAEFDPEGRPTAEALFKRLEGNGMLFKFLVVVKNGKPVLNPAGRRLVRRIDRRR